MSSIREEELRNTYYKVGSSSKRDQILDSVAQMLANYGIRVFRRTRGDHRSIFLSHNYVFDEPWEEKIREIETKYGFDVEVDFVIGESGQNYIQAGTLISERRVIVNPRHVLNKTLFFAALNHEEGHLEHRQLVLDHSSDKGKAWNIRVYPLGDPTVELPSGYASMFQIDEAKIQLEGPQVVYQKVFSGYKYLLQGDDADVTQDHSDVEFKQGKILRMAALNYLRQALRDAARSMKAGKPLNILKISSFDKRICLDCYEFKIAFKDSRGHEFFLVVPLINQIKKRNGEIQYADSDLITVITEGLQLIESLKVKSPPQWTMK